MSNFLTYIASKGLKNTLKLFKCLKNETKYFSQYFIRTVNIT